MQVITEQITPDSMAIDAHFGLWEQQFAAQTLLPTEQTAPAGVDPSMEAYMQAFTDLQLKVPYLSADMGPLTDEAKDALLGMQLAVVGLGQEALTETVVVPEIELTIDPGFIAMNEGLLRDSLKRVKSTENSDEDDEASE
ncbi:MAG TPA: hypothetical protein VFB59_04630 [Candidatus Saccharimonadales bacterium]|nr:hypothetical protein [Candidatus Saccharimonadales bacterium]